MQWEVMIEGFGCFLEKESPKLELCIYHHPVDRISMNCPRSFFHFDFYVFIIFVVEILETFSLYSISTPDGKK